MLLARLERPAPVRINVRSVLGELQARLNEWRELLRDQTPNARGLLEQLIVGRLNLDPSEGFYRFQGQGTLVPLLTGVMLPLPQSVASPTGFEPVFWP